ncbi:exodeoxyribonuclease VII large subunit [Methylocapsa acidiphila]|uniref:exodeoxyribonuclease VII large subunit n=1 Tax=Methylocapsa acidiphila TaxID=133552 RepID=UPI0004195E71|nr:exodeoxyribonuclease VII large subunit [Methylocapsa acidiphila]
MPDPFPSNAPELSVSELSSALKRTIEDRFGFVRVRGEISNFRGQHSSGHAYFSLKDQSARIDAVIWKGVYAKLKTKPQEGLEVVATGKITTYPGKSAYQIVIEALEPAGVGALMALFEERRRKLGAEGLFDEARKRPLPFLPSSIGVVTSPTGAVIRDILHRIAERFPRRVLVWPVRVQGETSAAEVAAAIDGLNALPETGPMRRPDVIIVARGGGSLEDLWSFNEEIVVRAAAQSRTPIIAAIGHETDWTLIDYAADLRAPTPTAAAEKAVPVRAELATTLADLGRRESGAMFRLGERRRADLRALLRALPQGEAIIALPRQRLDHVGARLGAALSKAHDRQRIGLARLSHRLSQQSPHARLARSAERLAGLGGRLGRALDSGREARLRRLAHVGARLAAARSTSRRVETEKLSAARHRIDALARRLSYGVNAGVATRRTTLGALAQLLGSLGYKQVLARGYALVRDADQRPLRLAAEIRDGAALEIEFVDGRRSAIAGPAKDAAPAKPAVKKGRAKRDQGSLF